MEGEDGQRARGTATPLPDLGDSVACSWGAGRQSGRNRWELPGQGRAWAGPAKTSACRGLERVVGRSGENTIGCFLFIGK